MTKVYSRKHALSDDYIVRPTLLALSMVFGGAGALASEPDQGATSFYNRSGMVIPIRFLRFADGGWSRGRDQGFALALQRNTSRFYLWIQTGDGTPLGRHLFCDGALADGGGGIVQVNAVDSFALADLKGKGSNFLVGVTDDGRRLLAWDLGSCANQGTIRASSQWSIPAGDSVHRIQGDILAGDFDGVGKDLVQTIAPESGELMQWRFDPTGLRLERQTFLTIDPMSNTRIRGIKYVGVTKLPHERDNIAYESATLILHDKGFTLARNDKAIAFSPNCGTRPAVCAHKTLIFNLDQGFTDGLQDLARKDRQKAADALKRMIAALHSAQTKFTVWALINPIQEDREATLFVLDQLALEGIPFMLEYYSSDVTNLASIKRDWVDYQPRAFEPLKGVSLDIDGPVTSSDSIDFYSRRYGAAFVGLRQMERLGIDINAKDPNGQPLIADPALAKRVLSFDWKVAERSLEWAKKTGKYVLWSDNALYLPYECYLSPSALRADAETRDEYLDGEEKFAESYPNLLPMYANNEGLKRCGVASGSWLTTPRNFRLTGWERIPSHIASLKRGSTMLTGPKGFGLSVQSWTTDYDPLLSAGTLPPEEVSIWALDGMGKGASVIEFEPYFYFFAWPPSPTLPQSLPLARGQQLGDPRSALGVLFASLGLDGPPELKAVPGRN
jgi:hypothetical protein